MTAGSSANPVPRAAETRLNTGLAGFTALLLALLASVSADARNGLTPFDASYELTALGTTAAESRWTLTRTGPNWTFASVTEPAGLVGLFKSEVITESSVFAQRDGAIVPLRYAYKRTGGKRERTSSAQFDWQAGRVQGSAKNTPFDLAVAPGTQDPLSYIVALMLRAHGSAGTFEFTVAGNTTLRTYTLVPVGGRTIETPAGSFQATGFKRAGRKGRVTTLWLAPSLAWLPVLIEHRERDGETLELTLQEHSTR